MIQPIWAVTFAALAAALASALGAVPVRRGEAPPERFLGWANAVAAGLMLGAAFALTREGLELRAVPATAGAFAGVLLVRWSHQFAHLGELDRNRLTRPSPLYVTRVMLVQSLHGAFEGVTLGVAAAIRIELGLFLALTFAVHNVAEASILCAVLRGAGETPARTAALAVVSNSGQMLLAIVVFSLTTASPWLVTPLLGLATGSLVYLVLADLLPEAYREAGPATIGVVTSLTVGAVVLLGGVFL